MILAEVPCSKCPRLLRSDPRLDALRPHVEENCEEHIVAMVSCSTKRGLDDYDYRPVYSLTTKGNNVLLGTSSSLEQKIPHVKDILEKKYGCPIRLSLECINTQLDQTPLN